MSRALEIRFSAFRICLFVCLCISSFVRYFLYLWIWNNYDWSNLLSKSHENPYIFSPFLPWLPKRTVHTYVTSTFTIKHQFNKPVKASRRGKEHHPCVFLPFLFPQQPPPSFLRIDTECRVLRFDSFSKTLGGGLRVGYAIGAKALIDKMVLHAQVSSQCVSLMSQVSAGLDLCKWTSYDY